MQLYQEAVVVRGSEEGEEIAEGMDQTDLLSIGAMGAFIRTPSLLSSAESVISQGVIQGFTLVTRLEIVTDLPLKTWNP